MRKKNTKLPVHFTRHDLAKFFAMIDRHGTGIRPDYYDPVKYRAIFVLSYRYGLRRGECAALDIDDIDIDERTIHVERLKGSIEKYYPLTEDLIPVVQAWLDRRREHYRPNGDVALFLTPPPSPRRMTTEALAKMFRLLTAEAGLKGKGYHFHTLRHSIAVHALEAGLRIEYVQDLLGHTNIQSTTIYARIMDTTRNNYMKELSKSNLIAKL